MRTGKIIQVSGSVVDVRFPHGELPRIREALSLPERVRLIPFSAEKGDGRDELLTVILHAAEQ